MYLYAAASLFTLGFLLGADEPAFDIKPAKPADTIAASKDGTIFTVKSKSGIGRATIELNAGQWPKTVTFRFQYSDGARFKGLEQFKLSCDKFKIEGSEKESGMMAYFVANSDGKFEAKGTAEVKVEVVKDGIDVKLPADQLKGVKLIQLNWVDFLRN